MNGRNRLHILFKHDDVVYAMFPVLNGRLVRDDSDLATSAAFSLRSARLLAAVRTRSTSTNALRAMLILNHSYSWVPMKGRVYLGEPRKTLPLYGRALLQHHNDFLVLLIQSEVVVSCSSAVLRP